MLDKDMQLVARIRLINKGADAPLTGPEYKVRLYDRDFIQDEYLGESTLDEQGHAQFEFAVADMNKGLLEDKKPDFFFVLFKNEQQIFQSKVIENLDVDDVDHYERGLGEVVELGTYLVEG
ncbi:MAG TPA: hypothetical protein PKD90_11400 [Phnomibacter sp.]|nr:hypothetical protein [Phnomibacter sp.]